MTPASKTQGQLRDILPELLLYLRQKRFMPHAILVVLGRGIVRGSRLSLGLPPSLRKSFFRSVVVLGILVLAQVAAVLALGPMPGAFVPAAVGILWFGLGAYVAHSQLDLVRGPDGALRGSFGIANTFTLYRFLTFPFVISLMPLFPHNPDVLWLGCVLFVSVAVSDVADGNWARISGNVTEFGRIYDPVCDIALSAGVCLGAHLAGYVPAWYLALAELRFFLPLIGAAWLFTFRRPWRVRPTWYGKASIFVYDVFIAFVLIKELTEAPFLITLTDRFLLLSGILLAFNLVLMIDRGLTMLRQADREGKNP